MPHIARLRVVSAALTTGALALGGLATVTAAATAAVAHAAPRRAAIAGSHPAWAVTSKRVNGPAAASGSVTARVYLARRDQPGLAAHLPAVSTPGKARDRHAP